MIKMFLFELISNNQNVSVGQRTELMFNNSDNTEQSAIYELQKFKNRCYKKRSFININNQQDLYKTYKKLNHLYCLILIIHLTTQFISVVSQSNINNYNIYNSSGEILYVNKNDIQKAQTVNASIDHHKRLNIDNKENVEHMNLKLENGFMSSTNTHSTERRNCNRPSNRNKVNFTNSSASGNYEISNNNYSNISNNNNLIGSSKHIRWDSSTNTDSNILSFINRDNILKQHTNISSIIIKQNERIINKTTIEKLSIKNSCQSCQMLEKAKSENLESIKMHILMRLQLTHLPNITTPIPVPHNIIDRFYKQYNSTLNKSFNRNQTTKRYQNKFSEQDSQKVINKNKDTNGKVYKVLRNVEGKEDINNSNSENSNISVIISGVYDNTESDINMQNDEPYFGINYAITKPENEHKLNNDQREEEQLLLNYYDNQYIYDHYNIFENDDSEYVREDDVFSHINSAYIFPKSSRIRHNQKLDILTFKFNSISATIIRCILHIYIRGHDWMKENNMFAGDSLLESKRNTDLIITIHRAVRRHNSVNFTHTIKLNEFRHKIPTGIGKWIQIDIDDMAQYWNENHKSSQNIIIKGLESWMQPYIVTSNVMENSQQNPLTVHIEILTKNHKRVKRSTSLDCQESDREVRCCRYPLNVNFTNLGWHFVVAPTSFDAYFCNGECKVGYLEQYTHTHIASLTTSATPCCSPTKMSPLALLYFNEDHLLVYSTIPNMSVEKCNCS